jgi:hypothetical protein
MKTYEEIIAENPNANFYIENTDYLCNDDYSLEEELKDNWIPFTVYSKASPKVHIAAPILLSISAEWTFEYLEEQLVDHAYEGWRLIYDDEDKINLQKCFDTIIAKNKNVNTVYNKGEQINISNLWKRLSHEN